MTQQQTDELNAFIDSMPGRRWPDRDEVIAEGNAQAERIAAIKRANEDGAYFAMLCETDDSAQGMMGDRD